MNMYWRDVFFYDITNAADTWETICTSGSPNTVLQNFYVHNKHSGTIVFNAKLVHVNQSDLSTTDIPLSTDINVTTGNGWNFIMESAIAVNITWGATGCVCLPPDSYIQVKSDVLNSMDIMCTIREYSQDKFTY